MQVFLWPIRVYYEDTDSGGVVYHSNYLKYMERSRTEWLRARGVEQDALLQSQDILFAVKSLAIDFVKAARFNQRLWVSTHLVQLRKASLEVQQAIYFADNFPLPWGRFQVLDGDELSHLKPATSCVGHVKIVCLQAQAFRPCAIPRGIMEDIQREC